MNRELKFRGKTINGEWYFGMLSKSEGLPTQPDKGYYISNSVGMPWAYQIIPETVGQFTGLKDKNGTPIFEGDVVEQGKLILTVKYRYGCFFFCSENDNEEVINQYSVDFHETIDQYMKRNMNFGRLFNGSFSKIEVIGNIHDK